jgi:cell division protein ZapA (FtsZ GTPase activity inhibitor)
MMDMLIFIAFAIVMLLLIAFFYFRDRSVFQKLLAYERAIDDLHSRLYELEYRKIPKDSNLDLKSIESRLDDKLNELGEPLLRTIRAIKTMEDRLERLEIKVDEKIAQLQSSTRSTPTTQANSYDDRIISLYKEGKSINDIAKMTRVGIGEVELILKLANLKK